MPYIISIKEAAKNYGIGEKKIRQIVKEQPNIKWAIWIGTQCKIKTKLFEKWIDDTNAI